MIFQNTVQDQPCPQWCPRLFLGASQCILRRLEASNSAFRVKILCINAPLLPRARAGAKKWLVLRARIWHKSSSWAWRLCLYLLKMSFLDSSRDFDWRNVPFFLDLESIFLFKKWHEVGTAEVGPPLCSRITPPGPSTLMEWAPKS